MNGIEAIQTDIKYIVKEQTECKEHQKEENDRTLDQLNEQKAKLETTKKGIYLEIEENKKEGKQDLKDAFLSLKTMIKEDITDPIKALKKQGIKIIVGIIGAAFVALLTFIWWLLGITDVITNLEKLIGG